MGNTLKLVFNGTNGPVLIYGEAGVGKTNLVLEALREASEKGLRSLYLSTEGSQYAARALALGDMRKVLFKEALTMEDQSRIILWELPRLEGLLDMVAVDTINSLYRLEAGEEPRAFLHLGVQLALLYRMASRGVKVVITGQVHGEGDEASGMWLVRFWARRIMRVERMGKVRVLRCLDPRSARYFFTISSRGVEWLARPTDPGAGHLSAS